MYPIVEIFGRELGTYSLSSLLGLVLCGFVTYVLAKKRKIGKKGFLDIFDIVLLMIAIAVGMFLGGHILYGITNTREIITVFKYFPKLTLKEFIMELGYYVGGMVYYGGFIGGSLAILIYTRKSDTITKNDALDLFAVNAPLFHVFGRIGCFLGGCCYGIESEFGFIVTDNEVYPMINGVRRLPVQLIEAFCNLLIFLVILYLFKKGIQKHKLIYIYMLIYPVVRFVMEFFRGDLIRGFLFGLSTSQWVSIILFVFAITKLILIKKKETRAN